MYLPFEHRFLYIFEDYYDTNKALNHEQNQIDRKR